MTRDRPGPVRQAIAVLRVAWDCYRTHLAVVVGLSSVASVERFALLLWGRDWPLWLTGVLELGVTAARIALLMVVFRVLIAADDRLRPIPLRSGLRRVGRFARRCWRSLVVQVVLIALAATAFDLVPEAVIAPAVPDGARPLYLAILLAVKNPTVIAFALIWDIALLRQALLLGGPPATDPASAVRTSPTP